MFAKFLVKTDCLGNAKIFCLPEQIVQIFFCAPQGKDSSIRPEIQPIVAAKLGFVMGEWCVTLMDRRIGYAFCGDRNGASFQSRFQPDISSLPWGKILGKRLMGQVWRQKHRAVKLLSIALGDGDGEGKLQKMLYH